MIEKETKVVFYLCVKAIVEHGADIHSLSVESAITDAMQLLEDDAFDVEELTNNRKIVFEAL